MTDGNRRSKRNIVIIDDDINRDGFDEVKSQSPDTGDSSTSRTGNQCVMIRRKCNKVEKDEESLIDLFTYDENDETMWKYAKLPPLTTREFSHLESMNNDAKNQCVKQLVRLFLTKGAKGETVDGTTILNLLKNIDEKHTKYKSGIIFMAQQELYDNFGYIVCQAKNVIGNNDLKKDEYFLSNGIRNVQLQKILAETDTRTCSYRGFVFLVAQIIFSSPGRVASANAILSFLRTIDKRFPDALSKRTSKSDHDIIPELGDDFAGLINRMKKESYLFVKDEDPADPGRTTYTLGGRFHNDIGKRQLLKAHFVAKSESVPDFLMNMVEEEDAAFINNLLEQRKGMYDNAIQPTEAVASTQDMPTRSSTRRRPQSPNTSEKRSRTNH